MVREPETHIFAEVLPLNCQRSADSCGIEADYSDNNQFSILPVGVCGGAFVSFQRYLLRKLMIYRAVKSKPQVQLNNVRFHTRSASKILFN